MYFRVLLLAALIPITAHAAPPTGERLNQVLNGALSVEPVLDNKPVTTAVVAAVATENTKKDNGTTQIFTVTNHDNVTDICFGTVAVTAAETCNDALCATTAKWTSQGYAAVMNCTASNASKGRSILSHTQRTFIYDGTRCACIVGVGASTIVQVERIVR